MENPAATLHCSNTRCQASNPQSNKFCQNCRTPLLRRYLWAIGQAIDTYKPGEVIADRYLLVGQRILLDTKPGMPPETPQDFPQGIMPYLRLSPYGLHIPKVYGCVTSMQQSRTTAIWLLEDAPIYGSGIFRGTQTSDPEGQLLPELGSVWKGAPGIRQLNWLWQLATLWQPLSSEGVASSLLKPSLLRVEGSIIRFLELYPDTKQAPTLQQLGQLWLQLLPGADPLISSFFQTLCSQLQDKQIRESEELVRLLDQALQDCGRSQSRTYQIFTRTDTGPSRSQNEDACYPPAAQLISPSNNSSALAIVCDGIGGHEGGEVASHLAIDTLREQVERLSLNPNNWNSTTLTLELERAACAANDAISSKNDSEHRSDRQRMGTTVVMAQSYAHEIYITHVGDSRVYWVTRYNCHQVTVDDDLASREVRLGYHVYRGAVQQPTSGSLVQALGMAPSTTLHPTVQRFVVDEDCVFLLCSDGLSDNDRVEQYWHTEILPILSGHVDLPTAGARLIEIANTQNGHDNATIALVHCKVSPFGGSSQTAVSLPQLEAPTSSARVPTPVASATPSRMKTQQLPSKASTRKPWALLLGIIVLLGLGSALAYVLIPHRWVASLIGVGSQPSTTPPSASPSPTASPTPIASAVSPLVQSAVIQVTNSTLNSAERGNTPLLLRQGLPPQEQLIVGVVPAGSILQVVTPSLDQQQDRWLQLKVCSPGSRSSAQRPTPAKTPPATPASPQTSVRQSPTTSNPQPTSVVYRPVERGDGGWIREAEILQHINQSFTPTSAQTSTCVAPSPSVSPRSTPVPSQTP